MFHNLFFVFPAFIVACVLVNLLFTSFRGFLLFVAFLAVLCGIGWLVCLFAPVIVTLMFGAILLFVAAGNSGGDLIKAFFVHSVDPGVSTGEAYMASEAHLI
jgi:hypothetical protein